MNFGDFHFKLNETIYTCRKVPGGINLVEILGTESIKGRNARIIYKFLYRGVEDLTFSTSINEDGLEVGKKLIEDLDTVSEYDLILSNHDNSGMIRIIIKTTSFEEYISSNYGGDIKPAMNV